MSLKRNTLLNLAGNLVPTVISLITIPLYLQFIGPARYGAWVIIWTFLSYFSVFEFGLSRAVANGIARTKESAAEERAQIFWAAVWLSAVFALSGAVLLYLVATPLLSLVFKVDADLLTDIVGALPWIAACVPVNVLGNVAVGALEGRERFLTINLLQFLGFTLFQIAPLAAIIWWGPSLGLMVAVAVLARALTSGAQWVAALLSLGVRAIYGPLRGGISWLLGYGAWAAVTGLANPIMESVDRLLIGSVLGAKSVAFYSVPFGLADKVRIFPDALQRSLFPKFSRQADAAEALKQAEVATLNLVVVMTLLLAPAMFAIGPFLTLWVGDEFAQQAAPLGQIFLLGMWVSAPVFVPRTLLQSMGRPDLVAKFQMAEFLPYVAILWLCLDQWGLVGAALAWVARGLADTGLTFWVAKLRWKSLGLGLPCALIVGAAFYLAFTLGPPLLEAIPYSLAFGLVALLPGYLVAPEFFRLSRRKPADPVRGR
jgi:O-antigen/teichoic acid export membrane protein